MASRAHALIPRLVVEDARGAADFYRRAFGAEEFGRIARPDGRMVRIALRILGSVFYISDMAPEFGGPGSPGILDGTTVAIHIEDSDPDALYDRAIAAGGMPVTLMQDMFWGERQGLLRDPFGHRWSISAPGNIDEQSRKAALKKRDP